MILRIESGPGTGQEVEVAAPSFVVGREEGCDLVLADPKVSRRHASFETTADGGVLLRDLGSANGTFVDEQRVAAPVLLRGGERVRVGDTALAVRSAAGPAPTVVGPAPTVGAPGPQAPPPSGPPAVTPTRFIRLQHTLERWKWIALGATAAALAGLGAALALVFTGGSEEIVLVQTETVRETIASTVVVTETLPSEETAPADTGAAGTETVPSEDEGIEATDAEAALLAHVVGDYVSCWRPSDVIRTDAGVVAAVGCTTADEVDVIYRQFDGAESMDAWYAEAVDVFGATADSGDCVQDVVSEGPWAADELNAGRFLCASTQDAEIVIWTHENLGIASSANQEGQGADVRQAVFTVFDGAGPR